MSTTLPATSACWRWRRGSLHTPIHAQQRRFWRSTTGTSAYQTPKVAAFGALFDAQGRVLLMQRSDNRLWAMPGGMVEVGETAAQAAEREFWEETGVHVRAERLLRHL